MGKIALLWVGLLVGSINAVNAAEFQTTDIAVDAQATDNTLPPCATAAAAAAAAIPGPSTGLTATAQAAAASGMSPTCDETAIASALATLTSRLVPTMGESFGDPVTVCASVAEALALNVMGAANASGAVGGLSPETQPVTVTLIRPGVNGAIVSVPPTQISTPGGTVTSTFSCQTEFTMAIGESLRLNLGGNAIAAITGVGNSAAATADTLQVDIGPCAGIAEPCPSGILSPPFTAPAASPAAMAIIAGIFAILGWRGYRRRGDLA